MSLNPTLHNGIVLSQNLPPENTDDFIVIDNVNPYFQTFYLPTDITRGTDADELRIPEITGFQLFLDVEDPELFTLTWDLSYDKYSDNWESLTSGTTTGTFTDGQCWIDIYFPETVVVDEILDKRFRLSFKGQSINGAFYSVPNPLTNGQALDTDATTGLQDTSRDISFMFKLLAACGDEGVDLLSNRYRSMVVKNEADFFNSNGYQGDKYWLSKPNPSKFAVESLYFDISDSNGNPTTVDRVLIDPLTSGPCFTVYYTSDGEPGTNKTNWEDKLWTPIPETFWLNNRQHYALPKPVTARYMCVEFSQLQAQHYDPGKFAVNTVYDKHPKWVVDYFILINGPDVTDDHFIPRNVDVVWDTLDLAYNYYLDDLRQSPRDPAEDIGIDGLIRFLARRDDVSDLVDPETMALINTSLRPFREQPGLAAEAGTVLGNYARSTSFGPAYEYPVERLNVQTRASTTQVSTIDREKVLEEKRFPPLYFYLKSRHRYRSVSAPLNSNVAYFVGIKELAFTRDNYSTAYDGVSYIETTGDTHNSERNDFVFDPDSGISVVYGVSDIE